MYVVCKYLCLGLSIEVGERLKYSKKWAMLLSVVRFYPSLLLIVETESRHPPINHIFAIKLSAGIWRVFISGLKYFSSNEPSHPTCIVIKCIYITEVPSY